MENDQAVYNDSNTKSKNEINESELFPFGAINSGRSKFFSSGRNIHIMPDSIEKAKGFELLFQPGISS